MYLHKFYSMSLYEQILHLARIHYIQTKKEYKVLIFQTFFNIMYSVLLVYPYIIFWHYLNYVCFQ